MQSKYSKQFMKFIKNQINRFAARYCLPCKQCRLVQTVRVSNLNFLSKYIIGVSSNFDSNELLDASSGSDLFLYMRANSERLNTILCTIVYCVQIQSVKTVPTQGQIEPDQCTPCDIDNVLNIRHISMYVQLTLYNQIAYHNPIHQRFAEEIWFHSFR